VGWSNCIACQAHRWQRLGSDIRSSLFSKLALSNIGDVCSRRLVLSGEKRSSLLCRNVNGDEEKFYDVRPSQHLFTKSDKIEMLGRSCWSLFVFHCPYVRGMYTYIIYLHCILYICICVYCIYTSYNKYYTKCYILYSCIYTTILQTIFIYLDFFH
jgi:hypothetical protein